jgi:predicted RNA-binding Zn-ribbon protein involved in translation (DUF1610 family)
VCCAFILRRSVLVQEAAGRPQGRWAPWLEWARVPLKRSPEVGSGARSRGTARRLAPHGGAVQATSCDSYDLHGHCEVAGLAARFQAKHEANSYAGRQSRTWPICRNLEASASEEPQTRRLKDGLFGPDDRCISHLPSWRNVEGNENPALKARAPCLNRIPIDGPNLGVTQHQVRCVLVSCFISKTYAEHAARKDCDSPTAEQAFGTTHTTSSDRESRKSALPCPCCGASAIRRCRAARCDSLPPT